MRYSREYYSHLYIQHLRNKGFSESTCKSYMFDLKTFFKWLEQMTDKKDMAEVTKDDLITYLDYLRKSRLGRNGLYSPETQSIKMRVLKGLFVFMMRNDYIIRNPFVGLDLTIVTVRKERESIPVTNMIAFVESIPLDKPVAVRDRAIIELLYGTGIRISELCNLDLNDLDLSSGLLTIRQGKGKKDRVVPVGKNLGIFLQFYLQHSRGYFVKIARKNKDSEALFLNISGRRVKKCALGVMIKQRYQKVFPDGKICPHMIRHSFATHMLERGAGIKYVKDILGHVSLETTVGYTHFSVDSKKRIVRQYHLRENELYAELTEKERAHYEELFNGD